MKARGEVSGCFVSESDASGVGRATACSAKIALGHMKKEIERVACRGRKNLKLETHIIGSTGLTGAPDAPCYVVQNEGLAFWTRSLATITLA